MEKTIITKKTGKIKNYILDTNVIIHDINCIDKFEDNNLIIPIIVIEELDNLKKGEGLTAYNARQFGRKLEEIIKNANPNEDVLSGITLPSGGKLRIELNHMKPVQGLPDAINTNKVDNKILTIALNLQEEYKNKIETILVSKDVYMTIKGKSLGLKVQDYENDKIKTEDLYKGYTHIELTTEQIQYVYTGGKDGVFPEEINLSAEQFFPNEMIYVTDIADPKHSALFKYQKRKIKKFEHEKEFAYGASPRNLEQKMAFEMLMDDNIPLVTITGPAGTGKTFLTMAAAFEKVLKTGKYNKIVLVRPITPAGDDIGFLPGTEEEKLRPWMGSYFDAVESLVNLDKKTPRGKTSKEILEDNTKNPAEQLITQLQQKGIIEIKTFTYMRGRNLSNCMVLIDEAQEMTPHLTKLMLTRAGENAKFVMLGDPSDNQIDNALVNSKSNGLVYIVEHMKMSESSAHIGFTKVERSYLAGEAEKFL